MYDSYRPPTYHGVPNPERKTVTMLKNDILKTEYDKDIDYKRQNLVIQSYFKYGPAKHNFRFIKRFFSVFARKQNDADSFVILYEGPSLLNISTFHSSVGILMLTKTALAGTESTFVIGMTSVVF